MHTLTYSLVYMFLGVHQMVHILLEIIFRSGICALPAMGYVTGSNSFPKQLSVIEEADNLERFKNGDQDARNVLIERNIRLVAHVAKKYATSSAASDDLISIGTIGLIKAISTFDMTKGSRLATYAARCIENAIPALRKH